MITETQLAAIEEQATKGGTINPDDLSSLIARVRELEDCYRQSEFRYTAEIAKNRELRAIVDRLPKTADGKPVTPGMDLYGGSGFLVCCDAIDIGNGRPVDAILSGTPMRDWSCEFYSTREAALAGKGGE